MAAWLAETLVACVLGGAPHGAPHAAAPPWSGAERLPADVDLHVHVDGAAELRRRLQGLPLAQAFAAAFVDEELAGRWSTIAQRLGRSEVQCFDDLLGRDVRLTVRHAADGTPDWLLVTEMDEATLALVREKLGGRMGSGGIIEFPCQEFVAAWREPRLIVGPNREAALLRAELGEAAPRAAGEPAGASLADEPLVATARSWPRSRFELFIRHDLPVAGVSVFAGDIDGRRATIRHRGRCQELSFAADPPDAAAIDGSVLARFEPIAIAGAVRRQCDASTLSLLTRYLPGLSPCEGMRRNAGDRWLLLVGAAQDDADECQVPSLAVAVEVHEPCKARQQHEAFLERAIASYNRNYAARFGEVIEPPRVGACADLEAPQQCDIGGPLCSASRNHPLLRTCSLHWRTVAGAGGRGSWQVYATHREWLDRVSMRLEEASGSGEPMVADAAGDSAPRPVRDGPTPVRAPDAPPPHRAPGASPSSPEGFLRGRALASMTESWGGHAAEFCADEPDRFRRGMEVLTSLLRGIEWIRWSSARPADRTVETIVRIELAPSSAP